MSDESGITRRAMMASGAAAVAGTALLAQGARLERASGLASQPPEPGGAPAPDSGHAGPGEPGRDYTPVVTPNGETLAWRMVDGIKVFHLIAEEVDHEFAHGMRGRCWGYNGRVHGPTIEAVEGDHVRIYVTNKLPCPTSVHWHAILLENGMDGVSGLTQPAIAPGETFVYEFTLRQHGTHFYHPHYDEMTQMALGMLGLFIIHPRRRGASAPDRDFAFMLSEWRLDPGTSRPNPNEMTDFNLLTLNGRAYPGTEPLVARRGDRVRIRIANGGAMDHHPIHLHGHRFLVTETDGGQIPESAQWPETTVLVPVGSTRTVEFIADAPGDWALHCHMTHHTMNQMGHKFPNMIGVDARGLDAGVRPVLPGYMTMGQTGMGDMAEHMSHMEMPENSAPMGGAMGPFGFIGMGGMFTVLKVREGLTSYEDPGWYRHPDRTVARPATSGDLERDGVTDDAAGQAHTPHHDRE